jgi:molybdate transport system ATP-binding protein
VKDGRIVFQGPKDDIFRSRDLNALYDEDGVPAPELTSGALKSRSSEFVSGNSGPLVEIKGATVRYKSKPVLNGLDWTILEGQNWALLGPNGSGKTTLLNLMYGDNPQVYANRVYMFGSRRGSGETVWEIKNRVGMVSAELQVRYRKPVTALEAVISGFFDTIGLYRRPNHDQTDIALQWMRVIGIEHLASKRFEWLSTGQQRLVLIARAMVKSPRILMLDEPIQGLDPLNRKRVLAAADAVSNEPTISLIFVSHYPDALPATISHIMTLTPTDDGSTGHIKKRQDP